MQNLSLFVYQLKTKLRKKKKLQNKVKENDNKTFNIADFS